MFLLIQIEEFSVGSTKGKQFEFKPEKNKNQKPNYNCERWKSLADNVVVI